MMNQPYHFVSSLFLAAAITAPASIMAAPKAQDASVQVRVYDAGHKDYHNWDDHEDQVWHQYLKDNHRKDEDFKKAKRKDQLEYWNWRHDHPDADKR